ncbi:hypothetical protein L226DRAFT_491685 [Lentinus tigrinus ALCF2SS1-7]|uniref:F-box domain-containing protein n=1 Tax=Lentinus tigrinus ALCF2SS1-6 TaxID=1328759 RepID=A0A5C2RZ90_9APHY|nr:hypothetical protein L227DRAFT_553538 [Lentinus tigrinus ALCF2SS1-6]RPD71515.1 hypothetical protein L226DRAFT_491685 [Lentinus tigrinus ALCF2SS1-7]
MAPKLPQELIDQTIDYLWNDVAALSACALACHACLPSARIHLFHDQRILGAKGCARFETFVDDCPDVVQYIRKLSVTEPTSNAYAQHWVNQIPGLVARLERLTTLELVGLHYVSLQRCSADTLAAFGKLTSLLFADVYFDHFLDVQTLLSVASNTQDLCIYRVGWGSSTPPAYGGRPEPKPLCLKRLVVDSWASSVMVREWLLPSAELGEVDVRSAMIRWRERDAVDVLNTVFRICGPTLEHLFVELPTTSEGAQDAPSLHHNANLQKLEIDGIVLPGPPTGALSLLDTLRSAKLEKLLISMLVLRNDVLPSFEWAQLDAILSRPHFRHVPLTITINRALHPDNNDASAVRSAIEEYLPGAVKREQLTINLSGWS